MARLDDPTGQKAAQAAITAKLAQLDAAQSAYAGDFAGLRDLKLNAIELKRQSALLPST